MGGKGPWLCLFLFCLLGTVSPQDQGDQDSSESTEPPTSNEKTVTPATTTVLRLTGASPDDQTTVLPNGRTTQSPGEEASATQGNTTPDALAETVAESTSIPIGDVANLTDTIDNLNKYSEDATESDRDTTATPYSKTTGVPDSKTTGVPDSKTTGVPDRDTTGVPDRDTTGVPHSQTTGVPDSQTTGVPHSQTTGVPHSQTTSTPSGQTTESTSPVVVTVPPMPPHLPPGKPSFMSDSVYSVLLSPTEMLKYVTDEQYRRFSTESALRLAKPQTEGILRVMRIPILPPFFMLEDQDFRIEVRVGLAESGTQDADIMFLLSDNSKAVGVALDNPDSNAYQPCYGIEGNDAPPTGIREHKNSLRSVNRNQQDWASRTVLPGLIDAQVSDFLFLFRPNQRWGACVLSDYGGILNPFEYNRALNAKNGLFLDVYLDNEREIHHLTHIGVDILLNRSEITEAK